MDASTFRQIRMDRPTRDASAHETGHDTSIKSSMLRLEPFGDYGSILTSSYSGGILERCLLP